MSEILFGNGQFISLEAITEEGGLKRPGRIFINALPHRGRCQVCGKHINELKPFGGPGDPLVGDLSGEFLVKRWRSAGLYDAADEKAWQEAEKSVRDPKDILPWLISKYGEKKAFDIYFSCQAYGMIGPSWECRDCIVLRDDEYFEAIDRRLKESTNK